MLHGSCNECMSLCTRVHVHAHTLLCKIVHTEAGSMSFVSLSKFTCTYEIRKSNSTRADFGSTRVLLDGLHVLVDLDLYPAGSRVDLGTKITRSSARREIRRVGVTTSHVVLEY